MKIYHKETRELIFDGNEFQRADLWEADLWEADLWEADLQDAKFAPGWKIVKEEV